MVTRIHTRLTQPQCNRWWKRSPISISLFSLSSSFSKMSNPCMVFRMFALVWGWWLIEPKAFKWHARGDFILFTAKPTLSNFISCFLLIKNLSSLIKSLSHFLFFFLSILHLGENRFSSSESCQNRPIKITLSATRICSILQFPAYILTSQSPFPIWKYSIINNLSRSVSLCILTSRSISRILKQQTPIFVSFNSRACVRFQFLNNEP